VVAAAFFNAAPEFMLDSRAPVANLYSTCWYSSCQCNSSQGGVGPATHDRGLGS
jgi:hypothetical protein